MAFYNITGGVTSSITDKLVPYAVFDDRQVMTCGVNDFGQLGINGTASKSSFQTIPGVAGVKQISAGSNHSLVL